MTNFIMVASGKGGVGKTTTAINLGIAMSKLGRDVIVLDGCLTTPNVGLYLGVSKVPVTLHDSLEGKNSILNAIYKHDSGLKVIPGDIGINALEKLNAKKLKKTFDKLKGASETVILDSSAGLNKETLFMMTLADEVLVVTTPDMVSVTDALKTIKLAESKNLTVLGIILNRIKGDDFELSQENIESILEKPVISSISESEDIKKALAIKNPVVSANPGSEVSNSFNLLAKSLVGNRKEINKEVNWFDYASKKTGLE